MTIAPVKTEIPDDLLRLLAEDAAAVFYWAFRLKMTRPQQIEETVKAFKKRLSAEPDVKADPATAAVRLDHARAL